jgi:heme-degrading monooxygenase HmoA
MTEVGTATYAALDRRQIRWINELAAGLPHSELATTARVLRELSERLDANAQNNGRRGDTMQLREIDERVTYSQQLQEGDGPVVLINQFNLAPADVESFLRAWADDATFMKRQPGFISTQLHRGTAGSTTFVNVAVWESARALGEAFRSPEFQARAARYPDDAIAAPHVFTKVAVSGVCVA